MDLIWHILLLLAACSASFFFALAETSLFALGKWRAGHLAEEQEAGKIVSKLLDKPQDLLAAIVLGNTLANSAAVGLAFWAMAVHGWGPGITLAGLFAALLALGEVAPKALGVRGQTFWAIRLARPMALYLKVASPVCQIAQVFLDWLIRKTAPRQITAQPALVELDYQDMLDMAFQEGTLAEREKDAILRILSLDQMTARDVMKPLSRLSCIPAELSRGELIAAARRCGHTRLPMYDQTPDSIVGILNARALLLNPDADVEDVVEFASFVPQSMNLLQLLKNLRKQGRGIAVVLDEFGGTAGLVTLADILSLMLGDFEASDTPRHHRVADDKFLAEGTCKLAQIGVELPEFAGIEGVATVGGLVTQVAEVVPAAGESVSFKGWRLTVRTADERKVLKVLIEREKPGKGRVHG